jgi:hypothetical protein
MVGDLQLSEQLLLVFSSVCKLRYDGDPRPISDREAGSSREVTKPDDSTVAAAHGKEDEIGAAYFYSLLCYKLVLKYNSVCTPYPI